jgi:hypothetical protein
MMFNFEVEIRVQNLDNDVERELFCHDFGGNQSVKHGKFFRILKKGMAALKLNIKGCDKGQILKLISMYDFTPIRRAKFLCTLK